MAQTKRSRRQKTAKPYTDFPLTHHSDSGQWCKKIRGRIHYFGVDANHALQKYLDERDALQAGRLPRQSANALTVRELVNRYLTYKESLVETGELSERTFHDYHSTCSRVIAQFGAERAVDDIRPEDFTSFRSVLAKGRGPHALSREVRQTRMLFRYAEEDGLTERHIRFGKAFREPSLRTRRQHRQRRQHQHSSRMFEAGELQTILNAVNPPMKAIILLGVNCVFGQTDCARLPKSCVDLKSGWIDFPRPKTGVERRCPLWPETVSALSEFDRLRPEPAEMEFRSLFSLTRYGTPFVHHSTKADGKIVLVDRIGQVFSKTLRKLGLKREGVNFYALRHTFETIAGESRDQVAVDAIMGHADHSMGGLYREQISDERLQAVADDVRRWLCKR